MNKKKEKIIRIKIKKDTRDILEKYKDSKAEKFDEVIKKIIKDYNKFKLKNFEAGNLNGS